jgi:hypothetical protein
VFINDWNELCVKPPMMADLVPSTGTSMQFSVEIYKIVRFMTYWFELGL